MFSSSSPTISANAAWKKIMDTPRAYQLIASAEQNADSDVTFYVLGCAGDLDSAQQQVADLMNKVASANKKPLAIFLIGDNFYHAKLKALNDIAFTKNFYDVYHHAGNQALAGIPFFVILGNHDHDFHFFWRNGGSIDHNVAGMQVMHTYSDANGEVSPEKIARYSGDSLALETLPRWNMPSRYYVLRYENIEFFLIDSSTYVKDYLAALKNPADLTNQVNWLPQAFLLYPDRTKMLFTHHPLVTMGKRHFYTADSLDTKTYITATEVQELKSLGIDGCYNAMLRQIIEQQGMRFDSVFAAHDHAMYYYNVQSVKDPMCQVIAGGGGGPLQSRESYHEWERVPAFINEHGFVSVTITPRALDKKIRFDFYGIHGAHLRFTNLQLAPMKAEAEAAPEVKLLHRIVLAAYEKYFHYLQQNSQRGIFDFFEKLRHRQSGVNRADNLRNYFNRHVPLTFEEAAAYLVQLSVSAGFGTENSLIRLLQNEILLQGGLSWEVFIANPKQLLSLSHSPKFASASSSAVMASALTAGHPSSESSQDASPLVFGGVQSSSGSKPTPSQMATIASLAEVELKSSDIPSPMGSALGVSSGLESGLSPVATNPSLLVDGQLASYGVKSSVRSAFNLLNGLRFGLLPTAVNSPAFDRDPEAIAPPTFAH